MISATPLEPRQQSVSEQFGEVEYFLRRADEESVAAIRSIDDRVHDSHAGMARIYSARSLEMIARLDGAGD